MFIRNAGLHFEPETISDRSPLSRRFVSNLCWRGCGLQHAARVDDACGISTHHMFLSNCVVQVMRVWSLPALLLPLAKQHVSYGVTQRTAYRISAYSVPHFARSLWWPWYKIPCTYMYLGAFPAAQIARSLRNRPARLKCPWRRGV